MGLEITEYYEGDPLPEWMFPGPGPGRPVAREPQARIPVWVTRPPQQLWDLLDEAINRAGTPENPADDEAGGRLVALGWVMGINQSPISRERLAGQVTAEHVEIEYGMAHQIANWEANPLGLDPDPAGWSPDGEYRRFARGVMVALGWLLGV